MSSADDDDDVGFYGHASGWFPGNIPASSPLVWVVVSMTEKQSASDFAESVCGNHLCILICVRKYRTAFTSILVLQFMLVLFP